MVRELRAQVAEHHLVEMIIWNICGISIVMLIYYMDGQTPTSLQF